MPLCEHLGYDDAHRRQRLALVGLEERDHALAEQLRERLVAPRLAAIVRAFYERMRRSPEFMQVLGSGGHALPVLERRQAAYLESLGRDFDTEGYFETRLRVGMAHVRSNVTLPVYVASHGVLSQLVVRASADVAGAEASELATRLLSLDLSLAVDAYHRGTLEKLEASLARAHAHEAQLLERTRRDSLTGVTTRDHVLEVLERTLKSGRGTSVLMIDLDHFKGVNDTHGHPTGDRVLTHVALRMAAELRHGDTLGRYGGEEFLAVLPDAGLTRAFGVAERLRQRVARDPVVEGDLKQPMTVSVGVATARPGEHGESLIARADKALYQAKAEGRDRVVIEAPSEAR